MTLKRALDTDAFKIFVSALLFAVPVIAFISVHNSEKPTPWQREFSAEWTKRSVNVLPDDLPRGLKTVRLLPGKAGLPLAILFQEVKGWKPYRDRYLYKRGVIARHADEAVTAVLVPIRVREELLHLTITGGGKCQWFCQARPVVYDLNKRVCLGRLGKTWTSVYNNLYGGPMEFRARELLRDLVVLGIVRELHGFRGMFAALADGSMSEGSVREAFAQIGEPAVEALIAALSDRGLRETAAHALGDIGDDRAVGPLMSVLANERHHYVKLAIMDALDELTGQGFGNDPAKWLRWWRDRGER